MKQFHGSHKKHSFFEGWYLKHQQQDCIISLIPAFHLDSSGKPSSSIQVITADYTGCAQFPAQQLLVNQHRFSVQIEKNHVSDTGISVDLELEDFYVKGTLSYGPLTPPETDMMGPFRHLPFMQCNHGVLSLTHSLQGSLDINGITMDFTGGTGYIEKDWGSSFPQSYLWTQSNWDSPDGSPCCVMLSIAHIPMITTHFTGCICSVYYQGIEYRLATYHHAKILEYTPLLAVIEQGDYRLLAQRYETSSRPLYAPSNGNMTRTIHESVSTAVRYHFSIRNETLFDITLPNSCFEYGDSHSES